MSQTAIYVNQVSFSYESTMILREMSLEIKVGEHVGIIGDSGCGKSTLLKLLAGLYLPDSGEITVMGETLAEKKREHIGLVMQSNSLFPLSIRDNITCGHAMSEEALWQACENASLARWIRQLPCGLDTPVGERGGQVSGGQAQRIQIARALCKQASVILLDEPASALDRDTGISVLQGLETALADKTVVHVTHHPEMLDSTYALYRLEGGKLLRE